MNISDYISTVLMFVLIALFWFSLFLFQGCAYQSSKWGEKVDGSLEYSQTNITPPFGKQAESAGQMSVMVLDDGSWELAIGRVDKGIDNTIQAEVLNKLSEVAIMLLSIYASGVAP